MADGKASSFCVHSFFLSQSKTPALCSVVFPPFLLRPKKKLLGNAVSGNMEKNMEKNHLGKNSRCFCWWFFFGVQKSFENKVISWSFPLRPCALHDFLLEKHNAQTTPLKLILRSKIQSKKSKRLAPLWIILLAEIRLSYGFYGLIEFLCLGKILSSAAACCFWKTFQSGCIWWDVTAINQSYARERHQVKLPLSRLKYSRRLNPCSSWWFRNPKQPPFVWKEPWILTGWSINWLAGVLKHQQYHFRLRFYSSGVYNMCLCCYVFVADINHHGAPYPRTLNTSHPWKYNLLPQKEAKSPSIPLPTIFQGCSLAVCLRDGNDWQRII